MVLVMSPQMNVCVCGIGRVNPQGNPQTNPGHRKPSRSLGWSLNIGPCAKARRGAHKQEGHDIWYYYIGLIIVSSLSENVIALLLTKNITMERTLQLRIHTSFGVKGHPGLVSCFAELSTQQLSPICTVTTV